MEFIYSFPNWTKYIKDFRLTCGIYCIHNKTTEKYYIGSTSNLKNRITSMIGHLRIGKYTNKTLQDDFYEFGHSQLGLAILEFLDDKHLLIEKEQYYFDEFMSCFGENSMYNIRPIKNKLIPYLTEDFISRFYKNTMIDDNGCFIPDRRIYTDSRGYSTTNFTVDGTMFYGHILAFVISKRKNDSDYQIPYSLSVLHTCHNSVCVNPDHLVLGTLSDNKKMDIQKDKHANQKISMKIVNRLRAFLVTGYIKDWNDIKKLSVKLNINISKIRSILRNEIFHDDCYFPIEIPTKKKHSIYIGVSKIPNRNLKKPFVASGNIGKKKYMLGSYTTQEEAAMAYNAFVIENKLGRKLNVVGN